MNRVHTLAERLGRHALRVSRTGETILEFGDQARPVGVHSIRRSFIGALSGQILERGLVSLDTRPARGAHRPGTHWCYSNWDINVLGNIYERVTHTSVFLGLDRELAGPLGMTDWDPYLHGRHEYRADPLGGTTRCPNYQLAFSARDLDRFGTLYPHNGVWADVEVVPAGWVAAGASPISPTSAGPDHSHYGHLWWVGDGGGALPRGSFSTIGMGGSFVTVVPGSDLVLAGLPDTHSDGFRPLGATDRSELYRTLIEEATLV